MDLACLLYRSVTDSLQLVMAAVSLLLLVVGACAGAGAAVSYNESLAQMQWGSAKATWYGLPNGAGPYDNGMHAAFSSSRRGLAS